MGSSETLPTRRALPQFLGVWLKEANMMPFSYLDGKSSPAALCTGSCGPRLPAGAGCKPVENLQCG